MSQTRAALVDALHSGHLGGAYLDVFETEPLPHDAFRRRRCRLPPARAVDTRDDGASGMRVRPGRRGSLPLRSPARPVVEGRWRRRAGPMNRDTQLTSTPRDERTT